MGDYVLLLRLPAETVLDCKMAVVENLAVDVLAVRLEDAIVQGRSMGRPRIRSVALNWSSARLGFLPRFQHRGTCFVVTAPATCVVVVFVVRCCIDLLVNRTRCKTWQSLRSSFRIRCRKLHLTLCVGALAWLEKAAMAG